jgi:hypothetical protein
MADRQGFCCYELNSQQSTKVPALAFSFRINNLLPHTCPSHVSAWSLLEGQIRYRHVQPLKCQRRFFATRYLPIIYNRRNHGDIKQKGCDVMSCSFILENE